MSKQQREIKKQYRKQVEKIVKSEAGMYIQQQKAEIADLNYELRKYKIIAGIAVSLALIELSLNGFFLFKIISKGY